MLAGIKKSALRINELLGSFFRGHGLELVDFKLEFGRTAYGQILLADEISPDTCRIWDVATGQKLDKDVFRRDLAPLAATYQQLAERIGLPSSSE